MNENSRFRRWRVSWVEDIDMRRLHLATMGALGNRHWVVGSRRALEEGKLGMGEEDDIVVFKPTPLCHELPEESMVWLYGLFVRGEEEVRLTCAKCGGETALSLGWLFSASACS